MGVSTNKVTSKDTAIYRLSTVYLPYIYRISTVIDKTKTEILDGYS